MRNLAFFLLGLLVSMALGIASAHAAWCTILGPNNDLTVSSTTPDTASTLSACTGPIVLQQSEYQALTASSALWSLDAAGATQIGAAVALVWAIAWTFRAVIRMVSSRDSLDSEE